MAIGKIIEVTAEGDSIEAAMESAVADAAETIHDIKHVWVEDIMAEVENNKVVSYRIHARITFMVSE